MELAELDAKTVAELQELASNVGLENYTKYRKRELIVELLKVLTKQEGLIFSQGTLEILSEGYGFLRVENYSPGPEDIYVSASQIRRFNLRTGDFVSGQVRPPKESERYFALLKVQLVNGGDPERLQHRNHFEELTPVYPMERIQLETSPEQIAMRLVNLVSPLGKGQRGLIVAPPKAGKTTLLKMVANSITANHPEIHLIVLLIDERPEEVTDMKRSVKGEVVSSTFDMPADNHVRVAEMVLERAKRMGGKRAGRGDFAGLPYPVGPGLQSCGAFQRPNPVGRGGSRSIA